MRIIKEYPHPTFKVSIFRATGRYHVQIRDMRIAVVYTLTDDQCETVQDVERWIEQDVLKRTEALFPQAETIAMDALQRSMKKQDDSGINII